MNRWRNLVHLALAIALALGGAAAASAQDWNGVGRLQGTVLDAQGEPIQGATVTLRMQRTGTGPDPLTTDEKGRWSYLGLGGGTWTILIEAEGKVPSEGSVNVSEFGPPSTPIKVTLQDIPRNDEAEEAVRSIERGNELLLQQQFAEARAQYETAIAKLPEKHHAMILDGIARTYLGEGDAPKAVETMERAAALQPDDPGTRRMLATTYQRAGDYDRALTTLQGILESNPADLQANFLIIETLGRAGRQDEAQTYLAALEQAVATAGDEPEGLRMLAQAYDLLGDVDRSVATLDRILQTNPEDARTIQVAIDVLARAGREEDAERYVAMLPEGSTVDPTVLLNTGINAYNESDYDKALASFDRVVAENPDLADAYYYRGLVYLAKQVNDKARADLEKLLEIDPGNEHAAEAKDFLSYLE